MAPQFYSLRERKVSGGCGRERFQFFQQLQAKSPHPHLMCVLAAGEQGQTPGQPLLSASLVLDFLFQMKTGPFAEHSNQLWNISAVPSWSKVNQGLIRMYKAEVSGVWPSRLPLLSLSPGVSSGLLVLSELGDLRT